MSPKARFQLCIVGVGGQGVLAAAQILGAAAHAERLPVVVGQLHGMSQRGGSVECSVILGGAESSLLHGPADGVISLEPLEALRAVPRMGPLTVVVTSRSLVVPFETVLAGTPPPDVDAIVAELRAAAGAVHTLDTRRLIGAKGETRTLNVLMLGAAAGLGLLPISERALLGAVEQRCGAKYMDANRRAFQLGRDALRDAGSPRGDARVRA